MIKFALKRITFLYHRSDPLSIEVWMYSLGLVIGIWLSQPYYDFFANSPFFYQLAGLTHTLGAIALFWSLLGAIALVNDLRRLRKISAFMGALFWMYLCTFSILNNPLYTSFPLYGWLTVQCTWLFFKIKVKDDR